MNATSFVEEYSPQDVQEEMGMKNGRKSNSGKTGHFGLCIKPKLLGDTTTHNTSHMHKDTHVGSLEKVQGHFVVCLAGFLCSVT